ncbi:MAG: hypothetical protein WA364_06805, partial [Candidatus Nitrosopolaris sp.]
DTSTPVQQAFMLQQRLTDVNHPDHTLITYPRLGHGLSPAIVSSIYGLQEAGPIQDCVLTDLYSWLEAHSCLSYPYVTSTAASNVGTNTTSISSSKR